MRSWVPAVCLTFLASCAAVAVRPEPPQPSIEAVQLAGGTGNIIRLGLTVKLHNPNDSDLALEVVELNVALNGSPATGGSALSKIYLPASGDVTIKLERSVPLEAIIFQLLPVGPNRIVKYEIDGSATTTTGVTLALTGKGEANWKVDL
jgi:hypothetical protein